MNQILHLVKKLSFFIAFFAIGTNAFSQLTGTKTIPTDYANVSAFVADANLQGIGAGGVTLNVPAGFVENITNKITLTATGTAANPIIIQKSGSGANPVLISYVGTVATPANTADGIFVLAGSDYVTIDGLDLQENLANTTTTSVMEFGYGLMMMSSTDGAQNNTIKNCTITLNRVQNTAWTAPGHNGSCGIVSLNAIHNVGGEVPATSALGSNSNNKFYTNTIQNCNAGIALLGTTDFSPFASADTGNDIGGSSSVTGNTILNFGGAPVATNPSSGIFVKDQYAFNCSYNNVNNNNGMGVNHVSTLRGIFSSVSSNGASMTFNNNTISLKSGATTSQVSAIEQSGGGGGGGNTININNNTITGCTADLATTQTWYGIYNTGASTNLNINNNVFSSNSTKRTTGINYLVYNTGAVSGIINMLNNSFSQNFNHTLAQSGSIYYLRNGGSTLTTTLNIENNIFANVNFSILGTTAHYFIYNSGSCAYLNINSNNLNNISMLCSGTVYIIYNLSNTQVALNMNNNQITTGFTRLAGAAAGIIYCIYAPGSSTPTSIHTISNNNFSNITATTAGTGSIYGIYNSDGAVSPYPQKNVFNNTISNINYPSTGIFYGIYANYLGDGGTSGGTNIYQNTISNVSMNGTMYIMYPGTIASPTYPAKIYSNTIQNITNNGAAATTYGFYGGSSTTAPYVEVYNNKLANITTGGTTGKIYGFYAMSAANYRIHNNYIGDLKASAALTTTMPVPAIAGFFAASTGNIKLYNNTIYLNATSTGANFSTAAVYTTQTGAGIIDARNNNFHNTSIPTGTGLTMGLQVNSAITTGYATTSNNNNWYVGTTTTSTVTYYNNILASTGATVANMSSLLNSDFGSIAINPPYLSTAFANSNYLHIDPAITNQLESGGQNLTSFYTTDYDSDIRATNTGYTGTGTSYDLGADEFNGITPAPSVSIISSVPSLTNQCIASSRAITANIATVSGTITGATLNYSFNGVAQTPITMVNTTGTTWTATIPVASPINASVTWNITTTNTVPITTVFMGTSYADEPLLGVNAFAYNTAGTVCSGTGSSLGVNLYSCNPATNYNTPTVSSALFDEDFASVVIMDGATTILSNSSVNGSLVGTIGTATGVPGAYSNFTAFGPYAMTAGNTYTFSLTSSTTGSAFSNSMAIFIDYNRNGLFTDPGEMVYTPTTTSPGAHTETGAFTIPLTAYSCPTRMRVQCLEVLITSAASTSSWGEYEDYMINISSAYNGGGGVPAITSATWSGAANGSQGTGNPLSILPTTNDVYTATVTAAGCTVASNTTTVNVLALPSAPTATNSTQCGLNIPTAAVASTAGVAGAGSYYWYDAATSGTLVQAPPLGAYTMFYSNTFDSLTIGAGATLSGSANLTTYPGELQLFNQAANQIGGITVNAGVNANAYLVDFDVVTTTGADGFSYSFGNDVSAAATSPAQEMGSGSKLKISFDAYGAMPNGQGIYLLYNNTLTSFNNLSPGVLGYSNNATWIGDTSHISVIIDNYGKLTLTVGATVIFNAVQLPTAYMTSDKTTWKHVIAGRTGSISMLAKIDNLYIQYANQLVGSTTFQTAISATSTYYVNELGTNGCYSATTPITVTVLNPDPIVVTPASNVPICLGQSFSVSGTSIATPAYTYSWDVNNYNGGLSGPTPGAVQTITPFAAGTFVYTITGTNGICTATSTVTTTVNPLPVITTVSASPTSVCNNAQVSLASSSFVTGPQTLPAGYCAVTNMGGAGSMINNFSFNTINNNSAASNPTVSPFYTGYNLTTTVNIGQTYALSVLISPPATYAGAIVSVWIDYNRDGILTALEWQQVGLNIPGGNTATIFVNIPMTALPGITKLRLRSRGNGNVNGAGDACLTMGSGETEDYQVNIQAAPPSPYNYSWNTIPAINTATGSLTVTNSTGAPIVTSYIVTVTEPISGCVNTDTTNSISIQPAISAPTVVNSAHCGLQIPTATANDVNNFNGELYNWYATSSSTIPLQSSTSNTYNTLVGTTTTFYVSVTDTVSGCESGMTPVTVTTTAGPALTLASTTALICVGNTTSPIGIASGQGSYNTYSWSPSTGVSGNETSGWSFNPSVSTVYTLTANQTSGSNCSIQDTISVSVDLIIPPAPTVPQSMYNICSGNTSTTILGNVPIALGSETYTLNFYDSFGDGWNGNTIHLYVNGVPVFFNYTLTTGSFGSISFPVNNGDLVTTQFNAIGSWIAECTYSITNSAGGTVFSGTPASATGPPSLTTPYVVVAPPLVPQPNYVLTWYNASTGGTSLGTGSPFQVIGTTLMPTAVNGSYVFYAGTSLGACNSATTVPVTVNVADVSATVTPIDASCNGVANGSFSTSNFTCGTAPFDYSVDGGAYGPIPTNLAAGTHTVVIRDVNNLVSSTYTITINQPAWSINAPVVSPNGEACVNDLSEIIGATSTVNGTITSFTQTFVMASNVVYTGGGTQSFTQNIVLPPNAIVTGTQISFNNVSTANVGWPNDYYVTMTGASTLPNTVMSNVVGTVTNAGPYVLNPSLLNNAGGSVTVNLNNTYGPGTGNFGSITLIVSYTVPAIVSNVTWWNASTGGSQVGAGFTLESVGTTVLPNTLTPGTYNFYAQGEDNGCTSLARTLVTVTVYALPLVNGGQDVALCIGQNATLTAIGAPTLTWDNSISNGVSFAPNATNTYTVTGVDTNGCVNQDQVLVTVNALPNVSAGVDQSICLNTAATVVGSGATSYTWDNSVIDNTPFTPLTTNTYTVTGVDANGCQNQDQMVVTVMALPVVSAGIDQTLCLNIPTSVAGSGALTYTWTNSVIDNSPFTPIATNTYTVTGVDANGCQNQDQMSITVLPLPNVGAGVDQTVCLNTVVTLTGSGALTYTWDNSVTNATSFTPTSTATYTVTGVDANGCQNQDQATITVLPLPAVSAGVDQSICLNTSTMVVGSGAVSYTWNNGVTNSTSFTPVSTNTYTVTGTGANGCQNQDQMTITVLALPTVNAGIDQTTCLGNVVMLTGSGTATSYTWNNGVINGQNFTPSVTGTYTVTGTGANGCTNMDAMTVTVNTTPSILLSAGTSVCSNGQVNMTATTSNAFGGFWSTVNGNGTFTPNVSNNAVSYNASLTDPSTVNFTYVAFNQCGSSTQNISTTVLPVPTLDAGQDVMVCENQSVTLNATSNGTVSWNGSVINNNPFGAVLGTNIYTATAVGINGCSVTDQVTVIGMTLPVINAGDDVTVCAGDFVSLGATGGVSYSWNNGVINNVPFVPTATSSYTVTGIGSNGCSNTDIVDVNVNAVPVASITAVDPVTLTASPVGANYQWFNCATGQNIADATGDTYVATANGSYAVIVTNSNGCSDTSACEVVDQVGFFIPIIDGVSVYPNPSSSEVYILLPTQENTLVSIFDSQGKLVLELNSFKNGQSIDLSAFTTGIYTFMIQNSTVQHIEKVVKQ